MLPSEAFFKIKISDCGTKLTHIGFKHATAQLKLEVFEFKLIQIKVSNWSFKKKTVHLLVNSDAVR